ncbi:MAG: hypothetical protein AAF125_11555 [Chloroflexota bacterium]
MTQARRGITTDRWIDWLTFRRRFAYETELKPIAISRSLAEISGPPPEDGNPLSATTPIAIMRTVSDTILFEINVARGLPLPEGHYIPFKAVGRISEVEDDRWLVSGELFPLWQGVVVYLAVLIGLLLWVVAAVTSAAISPYGSEIAIYVSLGTTGLLALYMAWLQWTDMRRLVRLVRTVTEV